MNKKAFQILFSTMLIGILLFLTYSCEEKFNDPYENLDNIHLIIQCNYIEECGGTIDTVAAAGADITILHYDKNSGSTDTLSVEKLDSKGVLKHQLPDSKGGISNVSFLISYNSFLFSSHMDYLCCDSTFVLEFERSCDEVFASEVGCDELNQKFEVDIKNRHGDCLVVGTPNEDMRNNSFSITSNDPIEVDVRPLLSMKGNFTVNISPTPNGQGIVVLNENSSMFVTIFTNTSVIGFYSEITELPVKCTLEDNDDGTGIILVNINSDVCEDVCSCPFDSDIYKLYEVDLTNNPVKTYQTLDFNNHSILSLYTGMLDENCYLKIKEIRRLGSNTPINTVNQTHNWRITSNYIDQKFHLNETVNLSLSFAPTKTGEIEDNFEVITEVYNKYDEISEVDCSFLLNLKGFGCEDICPLIIKTNNVPAELINSENSNFIDEFEILDNITMGNEISIKQSMEGRLGTLCYGFINLNSINYRISLPDNNDLILCQDIDLEYLIQSDGIHNDIDFFDLNWIKSATKQTSISLHSKFDDLNISFDPPSMSSHIQTGHDSIYRCKIIIRAIDSYGIICSQEIKVEALVKTENIKVSETQSMKAFSQVSDKESNPSFQAYKIDTYNEDYMYYGQVDNLKPLLGHINVKTTPPVPITDHSFYFEVDEPQNINLRQLPKLYLVDSDLNKYNNITSVPVARYNSNIEFHEDLHDLADHVFRPGVFSARGIINHNLSFSFTDNDVEWSPFVTASEIFSSRNGIEINLGDVFIVWNTNGTVETFNSGGSVYRNFCDIAFIYIDGISDGTGTQHHIGNVSFVVAYPLKTIVY